MKYAYLLLIILFFTGSATAQQRLAVRSYGKNPGKAKKGKYNMDQLFGRWQETSRMNSKTKEPENLVDTFYIHFYENGTADTKQGNSAVITGASELFTDDYVTTSASDFKIISVAKDMIVLDDLVGYLHSMSRTNLFSYEVKSESPVAIADTEKAIIDLSATVLVKNWFAYKRDASPGFVKPEMPIIRNLKIQELVSENTFKGEIEFAQYGKAIVEPCTLVYKLNMVSVVTKDNSWNIEVFKSDGKEMIMGKKGELVYYFQNSN